MKRFCDIGGRTYINLLDVVIPVIEKAGYEIDLVDNRKSWSFTFEKVNENSFSNFSWPEGHVHAGSPIVLREHQVNSINSFLENTHGLGEISTGAGKTMITAALGHRVQTYGRTCVIVPSKDLVKQTERDFKLIGLDVGVYFGDRKELNKTHTICTWQSIGALIRREDPDFTANDLLNGVVAVIVDESHSADAEVLFKILTNELRDCPIRWGMTGTIPLDKAEYNSLLASIGPLVNEVTAKELQDKGILSNLEICVTQIQDVHTIHRGYKEELKYLVTTQARMKFIADEVINPIVNTGNTLILVDRLACGNLLQEYIPNSVFICGNVSGDERKQEYDAVRTSVNKPIIATYGVAAVGIDIPRIFNVVLIEPGKSYVRIIQSIGRGIRKAADKDHVNIYDICSNAKYSKKHLTERKKFYLAKSYPFHIKKINGSYV
jgi:superfamily II DNA or RNA helicase